MWMIDYKVSELMNIKIFYRFMDSQRKISLKELISLDSMILENIFFYNFQ